MEKGNSRVNFNREVFVWCCEKSFLTDAEELFEECKLIDSCADVFDNSIGMTDRKFIIVEREILSVGDKSADMGISLLEVVEAFLRDGCYLFWKRVVFFEVVVALGVFFIIYANIKYGIIFFW